MRHVMSIMGLALSLGLLALPAALAVVSDSAPVYLERGYEQLAHARMEADSLRREALLASATSAFKAAYQHEAAGNTLRVQALLGVAQAALLVQSPRRVFPFLWQATPLQRAEKSLHQARVLQPDNAAASLLLGLVYARQTPPSGAAGQHAQARSQEAFSEAKRLGLPLRLAPPAGAPAAPSTAFGVEDTVLCLRAIDARGVGRPEDLLFVYQAAASTGVFGVVLVGQRAYPLITAEATETLATAAFVEAVTTSPPSEAPPILRLQLRQGGQAGEVRWRWDGAHFVALPPPP